MPAQLVAEDLCYLEVGFNILGSENLLEIPFPLNVFYSSNELLVVTQSIHVKVYHQNRDLLAILAITDS